MIGQAASSQWQEIIVFAFSQAVVGLRGCWQRWQKFM